MGTKPNGPGDKLGIVSTTIKLEATTVRIRLLKRLEFCSRDRSDHCVIAGEAGDPSGNWKWSTIRLDGKEIKFSSEMKYADGKLTGTVQRTNDPLKTKIDIEDGEL